MVIRILEATTTGMGINKPPLKPHPWARACILMKPSFMVALSLTVTVMLWVMAAGSWWEPVFNEPWLMYVLWSISRSACSDVDLDLGGLGSLVTPWAQFTKILRGSRTWAVTLAMPSSRRTNPCIHITLAVASKTIPPTHPCIIVTWQHHLTPGRLTQHHCSCPIDVVTNLRACLLWTMDTRLLQRVWTAACKAYL